MPWTIKIWIPVNEEGIGNYKTTGEALKEVKHLETLNPENIYRIVRTEEKETGKT